MLRWNKESERAFQSLKAALISFPVLRNPDCSLSFLVHVDTSEMGLGAVLSQVFYREEHLIMFTCH